MRVLLSIFCLFFSLILYANININFWKTENGVRVYFVESHELPIVDIKINFDAGSARDPKEQYGVANLTNYLMLLGAGDLDENQISNRFSDIGATLGGGIDRDHAQLSIRTLSDKKIFSQAVDTFKLVLTKPSFAKDVFEREKKSTLSLIDQSKTQPDSLGKNAFSKALYGDHPYSYPEEGLTESVSKLTQKNIIDFYNQFYSSQNASIVIVGDLSKTEAQKVVSDLTTHLKDYGHAPIPEVTENEPQNVSIEHPAQQAHLFYGMPSMVRLDKDFYPLYVGNYIVGGGGFVSRLTGEVREKNGLVYSVYSYFMPLTQKGPFQIGLQTKKSQMNDALNLVNQVMKDFIEKGPTKEELKDAKMNLIGGFPLRLDSNKKIAEYISMMAIYNYPIDYLESFAKNIDKVTIEDIKDAFQRRIDMSRFSTVIVGNS